MRRQYDVKYLGVLSPRPEVYEDDKAMRAEDVAKRLQELQAAVEKAHAIFLREIDNGRTPPSLMAQNGGPGLGYFEDII